jgi:thiol-disulfide isomerase/thioredoxin
MTRFFIAVLAFMSLLAAAPQSWSQNYVLRPATPDIYVVMFRADWCAPCKVVEPRLSEALQGLADPKIEFINIDISGGYGDWNANAVFDRGIVQQYNMWMGVTGFAAIIDGDTKQTLGCINMEYDAGSMAMHIRNLQAHAKQNSATFDLTCPEANNPI